MYEVSPKALHLCRVASSHFGVNAAELVAGLDLGAEGSEPDARIDWEVFATLCLRLEQALGSHSAIQELGEIAVRNPDAPRLRAVAGYFGSARSVYWAGCSWYGPSLFRNVRYVYEELDERELLVSLIIPEANADSQAFFHLMAGALRALPDVLGQPSADVTSSFSPRKAEYRILTPLPLTLSGRLRRWSKALAGGRFAVQELASQEGLLRDRDAALERNQRDLEGVLEALPHGVVLHYAGQIAYANGAFWQSLGMPERPAPDSAIQLLDFVHPDDVARATRLLARAPGSDGPSGGELRCRVPDGNECVLDLSVGEPVTLGGRELSLVVAREVSSRKRLQARLAQMDRLVSLGTLAAGVAHEINNPVTYVLGNLHLAQRMLGSGHVRQAELTQLLATASEGVERISQIVGDLKTFARPDERELGGVDIAQVLNSVVGLTRADIQRKAQLELDLQPVPLIVANRARLAQLFLNLLVNAIQALPEREVRANRISIGTRVAGPWVCVEIGDNGVGIDRESRGRVFEPFYSTKPAGVGTGLGLSICHGIVESLDGRISIESEVGVGTTLRVLLPHGENIEPSS